MDDGIYSGIWDVKPLMGFKKGKKYTFKLDRKEKRCYNVTELNENLFIQCASTIALERCFKNIKRVVDNN